MAYSTSNPPKLISQPIGGVGSRIWAYRSENPAQDVNDVGFFDNALELGMKVGDMVIATDTGSAVTSVHFVNALDTGGAADLATLGTGAPTDTD